MMSALGQGTRLVALQYLQAAMGVKAIIPMFKARGRTWSGARLPSTGEACALAPLHPGSTNIRKTMLL